MIAQKLVEPLNFTILLHLWCNILGENIDFIAENELF